MLTTAGGWMAPRVTVGVYKLRLWSLSFGSALAIAFALSVLFGLAAPPELHIAGALEAVLPGFRWLTEGDFVFGVTESFAYGVYAAIVIVPLHEFFAEHRQRTTP